MGNAAACLRLESELNDPTPNYELDGDMVTLTIHSGGKIEHGVYITDGYVTTKLKYDHVLVRGLEMKAVLEFADYLYGGPNFSLFVQVGNELKLVSNDNIVKEACDALPAERDMNVYVVDKISKHDEVGYRAFLEEDAFLNLSEFSDSDEPYEYDMREEDEDESGDEEFHVFESAVVERSKRERNKKHKELVVVQDTWSEEEDDVGVIDSGDDLNSNKGSDAEDEQGRLTFPTFNADHIFKPHFVVGMIFSTKKELKISIQSYAISEKRSVKFTKNDKRRLYAKCTTDECPWILRGLCVDKGPCFRIRELVNKHSCRQRTNIDNVTSTWLANKYKDRFINDPVRDINAFRTETVADLKVHVSRAQARKAKYKAIKLIEGVPEKQYEMLWSFAEEIKRSNPGSTVIIETDGNDGRNRFDRMYVCLNASKEGFINGCRPVICLDGCWLKGLHGGILLTACGIDANNSYLPIAYAAVEKESTEIWAWFMRLLKQDLQVVDTSSYTLMSDKQKGLIQAEQDEFPGAEYRFCARHLLGNFRVAGFKGVTFKNAFWKAARCTTINSFERVMDEIHKMDPKAEEWLRERPPSQWCKAFFRKFPRCDVLTNNACETFNANILTARKKPILAMFLELHSYMMARFAKNQNIAKKSKRWKEIICPRIQEILDHHDKRITDYIPLEADEHHFQVQSIHNQSDMYSVDLKACVCGCGKWQVSGIPCLHAMVVISYLRNDVEPYTHKCYYVESYKKTYKLPILPINSLDEWPRTSMLSIIPPVKPKQKPGRPTTKRRLESGEQPTRVRKTKIITQVVLPGGEKIRRQQETVKCSKCGKLGHNAKGCKEVNRNVVVGASQTGDNIVQEEIPLQVGNTVQGQELSMDPVQNPKEALTRKVGKTNSKQTASTVSVQERNETEVGHEGGQDFGDFITLGDDVFEEDTNTWAIGGVVPNEDGQQKEKTLLSSMIELSGPIPSQLQESQSTINIVVPAPVHPTKNYTSSANLLGPVPEIIKGGHRFMTLANVVKRTEQLRELRRKGK